MARCHLRKFGIVCVRGFFGASGIVGVRGFAELCEVVCPALAITGVRGFAGVDALRLSTLPIRTNAFGRDGGGDDLDAAKGVEVKQVCIARDDRIDLGCQCGSQYLVIGGIADDGGRDECGYDDRRQCGITVEQVGVGEAASGELLGELLTREHAVQLGQKRRAADQFDAPGLGRIDQAPRRAAPEQSG